MEEKKKNTIGKFILIYLAVFLLVMSAALILLFLSDSNNIDTEEKWDINLDTKYGTPFNLSEIHNKFIQEGFEQVGPVQDDGEIGHFEFTLEFQLSNGSKVYFQGDVLNNHLEEYYRVWLNIGYPPANYEIVEARKPALNECMNYISTLIQETSGVSPTSSDFIISPLGP